jgi:phosphonopyruvate decarboxylase
MGLSSYAKAYHSPDRDARKTAGRPCMIPTATFCELLRQRGYSFYTGVPCSYFRDAIDHVSSDPRLTYVIAANEGAALGIAAGAWLAGHKPVLLIQNSGVGNLVNPLSTLCLPYRIPSLLFVSARAYPDGVGDEPHHRLIGAAARSLWASFGVHCMDMVEDPAGFGELIARADEVVTRDAGVVAVMVPRGRLVGAGPAPPAAATPGYPLGRAEAVGIIAGLLDGEEAVVSTTGRISRELFLHLDRSGNFYMQGSMGHARAIALGIALSQPRRRVLSIDGDGATLMHLGSLSTVGYYKPPNLVDVVLDNEAYESTGNQDTTSPTTDLALVAQACGYVASERCTAAGQLGEALGRALRAGGPSFLHVKVSREEHLGLPRVTDQHSQEATARIFRRFLQG